MLVQIISNVLAVSFIGFIGYSFISHNRRFKKAIEKLETELGIIIEKVNIDINNADIKILENKLLSFSEKSHHKIILDSIRKGYDLIASTLLAGDALPFHVHSQSNVLVYVLEGNIKIETLNKTSKCYEDLVEGQAVYIKHGKPHKIIAITNSRFIKIAKPPLFFTTRVGDLYERFKDTFTWNR